MRLKSLYALALIATLWCHQSHADELQDRLKVAIKAYGDLTPDYPDVSIGIAQALIDAAVAQSNPSQVISTSDIGAWIENNQPSDNQPELRKMKADWLSKTLSDVMKPNTVYATALPAQDIRVAELQLRINKAIDDVMPGKSNEEIAAEMAEFNRQYAEIYARGEVRKVMP